MKNRQEVVETIVQYQFVLNHLKKLNGRMVCDVGIGPSPSLWYMLNAAGYVCIGLDKVKRVDSPRAFQCDITKIGTFCAEQCSGVFCLDVLHNIKNYDQAVFNMIRMSKPGGLIVLAVPYNHYKYYDNVMPEDYTQVFSKEQVDCWCKMIGQAVTTEYWRVWDGDYWRQGKRYAFPKPCDCEKADMIAIAARVPYTKIGYEKDMARCNYKLDDSWFRYHNGGPQWDGLRKRYNHIINSVSKGKVLDIGCGPGVTTTELRKRGFTSVGLDYSDKIIRIASTRPGQYEWGRAENLPFADNEFNTVIMTEVLEHVTDVNKSISEADRVANADADILISVPDGGTTNRFHLRTFDSDGLKAVLPGNWQVTEDKIIDERIWLKCRKS